MEWSHEKIIELIDVYKQKNILWNPTNPHHFNRFKKNDAWEEIACETGISVEHCKKKMEYLLAALRREKGKMKKSLGTGKGADEVYKSTWFAFDSLKFILDKNTPRQTFNTIESDTIDCEEPEKENEGSGKKKEGAIKENEEVIDFDEIIEKKTESTSAFSQIPAPPTRIRKRKATNEDKRLDQAFEILKTTSQTIQDDCQHFGNLVAAKLRKFNEDVRTSLESDIMRLFVNANKGFYNLPMPSTCNSFPRGQILSTQQTNNSAPQINRLPSQCHSYTSFEHLNDPNISSPASTMSSEDSFIIADLV